MRFEVFYRNRLLDGRVLKLTRQLERALDVTLLDLAIVDVYLLDPAVLLTREAAEGVLSDPVTQECITSPSANHVSMTGWSHLIETRYRAGVTDPVANTAREAIRQVAGIDVPEGASVQTARQYLFWFKEISDKELHQLENLLFNPLIQDAKQINDTSWLKGDRFPDLYPAVHLTDPIETEIISVATKTDAELKVLSNERLLALSLQEMLAIKNHYASEEVRADRCSNGLPEDATDVELEMLAQTWSEHCKHKILNAIITYEENNHSETIDSLFDSYIRKTTEDLSDKKDFLRSVFHDDSGVIQFDKDSLICFKVETHNSPSALDPYGGAITGIVGVNRDILGTGKCAKPIFNTNVLCFGFPDTDPAELPEGLLHPRQVLSGVHHGIIDGGNQSGIPVVGGAFLFDESYIGKPLVFCGTGGILPSSIGGEGAWIKHIDPGDVAVMVGGRIGKDGIHGATFSSLALDDSSPTSAVQIGDPITQKKMSDFLLEARDRQLFKGLTDNGAGGLSSSLGEMAEMSGGVRILLDSCPLKYEGLAPWEILVSESQERMSLAVHPEKLNELLALARRREVEATVVGDFTDSGYVEAFYRGQPVCRLSLFFLHHGLPKMELSARWKKPARREIRLSEKSNSDASLLALLSDPNIASKEPLIRQYDHEVQGSSVIKPFAGLLADGPSDGAVIRPRLTSQRGLTITHGICPRFGDVDTYHMAQCAVDEAFRAHIALGGDPETACALDNFCWPDPVLAELNPDGDYKLAQLVRACKGLRDACLAYGIPLISGKDSMKNDANLKGKKVSVRPTLLISLMGIIKDVTKAANTDFRQGGDLLYVLGETMGELGGTAYERNQKRPLGKCPELFTQSAFPLYQRLNTCISHRLIESCHDLSDGGFAVALAECSIGGGTGCSVDISRIPGPVNSMEDPRILFCETPSRFLVSVAPQNSDQFLQIIGDNPVAEIGRVTDKKKLQVFRNDREVFTLDCEQLAAAWKSGDFA